MSAKGDYVLYCTKSCAVIGTVHYISRDIIELMPIAALMSANDIESLGSNLNLP
jgi:hypothetical protein